MVEKFSIVRGTDPRLLALRLLIYLGDGFVIGARNADCALFATGRITGGRNWSCALA
jgi:hypothetical protein